MFYFQSDLVVKRLYSNTVIVTMPQFQLDMYYSFLFSTTGQMCVGIGWDLGQVLTTVKTTIEMRDCEKIILNNVCDLKTPWLGNSAQWLE